MSEEISEIDYDYEDDPPCVECGHGFFSHDMGDGSCCEMIVDSGIDPWVDCDCQGYKETA